MNTFERELSKVFTDCKSIDNPTFVGSARNELSRTF